MQSRNDQRSGLIASGAATSTLSSRADNDRPTNEPPVITAARQLRPSTMATTIRVSSTPSTFRWRELEAIWIGRRLLFWLRSQDDFHLSPDLYGSLSRGSTTPAEDLQCIRLRSLVSEGPCLPGLKPREMDCWIHGAKDVVSSQYPLPWHGLGTDGDRHLHVGSDHSCRYLPAHPT